MWIQDSETGDWKPRALSALTADDGGDAGGAGGDGGAAGGSDGAAAGGEGAAAAGGDTGGSTPEFKLDMIQGLTPAQLTADETLAKDPSIAGYQTLDDLMRSHRSAQKMVGNPDAFVKVPTESATEEERAAFFTRLGRPESPDGYKFKDPEGLPAGALPPADDFVKSFQGKAHEVGVSSDQAQKLYEWYRQNEAGELGRFTEQREADKREAEGALKQEWGAAFTTKLNAAEGVLNGLGDGLKTKLVQSGLQNDPDIIRMLAAVAEARGEDVDTRRGDSSGGMLTPAQAKAEAARLRGDEVFQKAWLDKTHPGHADAVTKMARLSELAYQDPSSG